MTTENQESANTYKVGDILCSSWGYDQTNVDFYQVTKVTPKCIRIRHIRKATTEKGFMCGESVPCPNDFTDSWHMVGEVTRRVDKDGWIRIDSCEYAHRWNGQPQYTSWYA